MATQDINIRINLRDNASAKVDKFNTNLGGIGNSGSIAAAGITKMLGPLAAAIAAFQTMKRVITGVSDSIKLFADFDDTMRKVKAVTKATDAEFQAMVATAKQLGSTTRYTATQSAEALAFLGMAGFEATQAMEALPNVLNLAAAGGLDLGVAADIATNILSGFGLEVSQLARVNDVLAEAFTGSNTTLTELGEGFKYVGPIAKGVGADFEDLIASMGKLGDAGIKGSLAGTTLRGVIDALFNPTREEAVLMEDLSKRIGDVGLQIKNNKGNFVGFRSLVEQLEKAGLRGEEALKLFGARAGPGMAALLQVGSKALGDFEEELNNVDDTTSKIAATQEGGIGGAFRGLASAIEGAKLQLGEAFGEGLITTIQTIAESFRDVTKAIKELDESGIISKITKTLEVLAKTGGLAIDSIIAYAKEFYNLAAIGLNALTLNFDKVKERLDDVGKSFRSVLQERGVLGSDLEIQLGFINQQIDSTETQIEVLKKKIEQDRIDANGWRAKIAGAKQYEEQLARHNDELQELFQKVWELNNTKLEIETNIKLEGLAQSIADEVRNANEEIGKIGTGTKDSDTNAEAQRLKALAEKLALEQRRLSEANAKYLSDMKVIEAELESNYEQGVITLRQYYEGRRKLIEDAGNIEIAELQRRANEEIEGSEKASKADLKVYASKQKLTAELIKLDNQFITDSKKMEDELLKIQSENIEKKLAAEKVYNDLRVRIQATGAGDLLEAEHQKELADLQARQRDELAIVEKGIEDELKLEEYKANQKREIDQLEYAHHKKVMMARLEIAQEIASGTSEAFADLYEMTGKKQKEWFYLAKAAALAEVAVSTATGIMKAYEQMGPYGAVGAALVAVQGAIQTSKILSTGLAAGGIVPGYSPNDKADNIPARLTAGEYVQPVDVVKHYGVGFMEALRQKTIPRDAFAYAGIRASNISKRSYADGGVVLPSPSDIQGTTGRERITIVNYTDRQELLSALSTKDGINAVVNVISANREKVARVLR